MASFQEQVGGSSQVHQDAHNLVNSQAHSLATQYSAIAEDGSQEAMKREAAMMFSSAEESLQDGDADEALKCSKAALSLFRSKGEKVSIQDSLFLVIKAYIAKGNFTAAESEVESGLKEFKGSDKRGEACMLLSQGEVNIAKWSLSDAKTALAEAVTLFKDTKDMPMASSALLTMAKANVKGGDTETALKAVLEAVTLAKDAKDATGEAKASLYAALVNVEARQYVEAETYAETAVKIYKSLEQGHMQVAALGMLVDVTIARENPRKAAAVAEEALQLCNKLGYTRGMGGALHATVFALLDKGEVKRAMRVAQDGLVSFKATGNIKAEASAHSALAYVLADQHDFDAAVLEVNTEIDILKTLGDSLGIASAYLRLSGLQAESKQGSDAIASAESATNIYKTLQDKRGEGIALYAVASAQMSSKRFNEATSSIENATATFQEVADKKWQARATWLAGSLAIAKDDADEANNKAAEAQELSDKAGDKRGVTAALLLSSEAFMIAGAETDFETAISQADQAQQIFAAMDSKKGQASALQMKARVYLMKGEPAKAIGVANQALAWCKRAQDKKGELLMQRCVADANMARMSETKMELSQNAGDKAGSKGKNQLICRSANEAVRQAKSAASSARFMGDKVQEATSLLILAEAEISKGHAKKALKSCLRADEILAECDQGLDVKGGSQLACSAVRGIQTAAGHLDTDSATTMYTPAVQSVAFLRAHALATVAEQFYNYGDDEQAEEFANRAKDYAKQAKNDGAESIADAVLKAIQGGNQQEADPNQMMMLMMQQQQQMAMAGSGTAVAEKKGLDQDWVMQTVSACVKATVVADEDELHLDSPLMEMGMDSLSSVGFRNTLNAQVGMNLPAALMFDYPSQRAIVDHIIEQSKM